jgi:hypothetical protein
VIASRGGEPPKIIRQKMTLLEFKSSIKDTNPPSEVNSLLRALWYDYKNDWETAHNLAQEVETNEGSWVHGYLHRKEGDDSNARYWYSRAGKKFPKVTLEEEWDEIASALLSNSPNV